MRRPEGVAAALLGLEARAWALLLRSLRARSDLPPEVDAALAHPTSGLASGQLRRSLSEAIAASAELLEDLRSDTLLPAALHAAIVADPMTGIESELSEDRPDDALTSGVSRADRRAKVQTLRRALEEERRRREGAEVRAESAEARADAALAAQEGLERRIAELEAELRTVQGLVDAAAARAERRSSSRTAGLERELAAERAALASLRREHERCSEAIEELRSERDHLRAMPTRRPGPDPTAAHDVRPLLLPSGLREGTTEAAVWLASRADLLLIDGYNVAKLLRPDRPLEDQRRWLIERLRPFGGRATAAPVVVFDGDRSSGQQQDVAGVDVRFSPGGVTADDEIVFAVAATDRPVLVVTDDVELGERVRTEGGNVVGAVHLLGIVDG